MALTYKQWLKAKGYTKSTPQTRDEYWASGHYKGPKRRATNNSNANTTPFTYASQIAADPLSVPFGSEIIWQGKAKPNMNTLQQRGGFDFLTPIQRPDGGWAVFGVNNDPTPDWAKDQLKWYADRGKRHQSYAEQTIMPWLQSQLGNLQNASNEAQASFANTIGQMSTQLGDAAANAGVGAAHSQYMAPHAAEEALAGEAARGQGLAQALGANYQGAVDQLQGQNLAQSLLQGTANEIMRIPDRYDEMRQNYLAQLTPIIAQIERDREQMEFQRRAALEERDRWEKEFKESRRRTNEQLKVERQIAGLNAEVELAQTRQRAQAAAAEEARATTRENHRTPAQIRSGLKAGETLLNNNGKGWATKPSFTKYHGKPVTWEQATNGRWYGVVSKGSGGKSGGNKRTPMQKAMQEALATARKYRYGATDPETGQRGRPDDQLTAAHKLVEMHGVPLQWALSVTRRLGYPAVGANLGGLIRVGGSAR